MFVHCVKVQVSHHPTAAPTEACVHTFKVYGGRQWGITPWPAIYYSTEPFLSALPPNYISAVEMLFPSPPTSAGLLFGQVAYWLPCCCCDWTGMRCISEATRGYRLHTKRASSMRLESFGWERHQWVGGRETPHNTALQRSDIQCSSMEELCFSTSGISS